MGLGLLQDLHLAGLIMWVPMGPAYLAAASVLLLVWLREIERRQSAVLRQVTPLAALLLAVLVALTGCRQETDEVAARIGDAAVGAEHIDALGCGSCHMIPGIERANGLVGPPLDMTGRRIYIAGVLRNTPENMIQQRVPAVYPTPAISR